MQAFGADLTILPSVDGKVTPDLVPRMIEQAAVYAAEPDTYWTDQLKNADSLMGYRKIGEEILDQMDRPIDVFCTLVGTAGLAMGVSSALADRGLAGQGRDLRTYYVARHLYRRGGNAPRRRNGYGFIPPLLDTDRYDEVRGVDEEEGRAMARRLAAEEGLFAGTSSGLNVVGAIQLAEELGPAHTVVTVAVDTGMKYLAGDLFAG